MPVIYIFFAALLGEVWLAKKRQSEHDLFVNNHLWIAGQEGNPGEEYSYRCINRKYIFISFIQWKEWVIYYECNSNSWKFK